MAETLGHVEVLVTADTSSALASINSFKKQLSGMGAATTAAATRGVSGYAAAASAKLLSVSQSVNKAGRAMTSVGSTLTYSLGLPLALLGTTAVKSANNFESAFARIEAIAGKIGVPIDEAKEKVKALATQFGEDPQKVAEALYFIASAGVKAKDVMSVLEYSVKGAAEQLADSATIAQLLTTVMNNYGSSGMTAARGLNILTAAITAGKAEPEELAASLANTIPMASQLGVSFESMTAAIAAATNAGLSAARASTGLRFILGSLQKVTPQAKGVLEDYGLTVGDLQAKFKELGAVGGIQYLSRLFDTTTTKGKEAFAILMGGQRGLIIANALIGENLKSAEKIDKFVSNKADSSIAEDALKKSMDTRAFKFKQMNAQLKVFAIELGDEIVPILLDEVFPVIRKIIDGFSEMSESSKKLLIWSGIFLTVLGPLLMVSGAVLRLVGGLSWIASKGFSIISSLTGMGAGLRGLAGLSGLGSTLPIVGPASAFPGAAAAGAGGGTVGLIAGITEALPILLPIVLIAAFAWIKQNGDRSDAKEGHKNPNKVGDNGLQGMFQSGTGVRQGPFIPGQSKMPTAEQQGDLAFLKERDLLVRQYNFVSDTMEKFAKDVLKRYDGITDAEAEALASSMAFVDQFGGGLDKLTRFQIRNALKLGNVSGALDILSDALARAVAGLDQLSSTASAQAQSFVASGGTISKQFRYPTAGGAEHGALIGLAGGGFLVSRPTFIRGNVVTGEKRKKEAVIPLEDVRGRRVLAGAMADAMGGASRGTVVVNVAGKVERPEDIRRELDWWMRSRGL